MVSQWHFLRRWWEIEGRGQPLATTVRNFMLTVHYHPLATIFVGIAGRGHGQAESYAQYYLFLSLLLFVDPLVDMFCFSKDCRECLFCFNISFGCCLAFVIVSRSFVLLIHRRFCFFLLHFLRFY